MQGSSIAIMVKIMIIKIININFFTLDEVSVRQLASALVSGVVLMYNLMFNAVVAVTLLI